jgi:hypothetical protein
MRVPKKRRVPKGLVDISQILEGALEKLGVRGDWDRYRIEAKCREWLGETASKALVQVEEWQGTVTLSFNHSAWLNEMSFKKQEGLEFLRKEFPHLNLKELRVLLFKNTARMG